VNTRANTDDSEVYPKYIGLVFTALHGMQTRSSDENYVRLSVRLSVKRVNCDSLYTIRKII